MSASPRRWSLLALALVLILVTVIRLRLAPCPLERDEGEYAFIGQLMLQGIPPYTEAANLKFPGTYASYAIIEAVFGQTAKGIHHGLLIVNLATILLVYHLGNRFFGSRHTAVMAAAVYAVSSLSFSFLGPMAHATHFVVFFGLAGIALLLSALRRNSLFGFALAGAVTGFAYMAKQSGFYFVPFGCLLILSENVWRLFAPPALRASSYFLAGAFAPFALAVFAFQQLGCLDDFIFWTFRYASTYHASISRLPALLFQQGVFLSHPGVAWIFLVPCLSFFLPPLWSRSSLPRRTSVILALFLVLSLIGVSLGLVFRQHYFIQALPAVALLSASSFATLSTIICRRIGARRSIAVASMLCLLFCGTVVVGEAPYFFRTSPAEVIWELYPGCPFVESITIADYIQQHSQPQDRVFVFGSEPQIYFYSKRHAATNDIYLYNLLEEQPYALQMQRKVVADVSICRPRFFVESHQPLFEHTDSEKDIPLFQWKTSFLAAYYRPVLVLDRDLSNDRLTLNRRTSASGCFIMIWERNP